MSERDIVIFDLDNTISDDSWRIPRIRWHETEPIARYHDYHLLAGFDAMANGHLIERHAGCDFVFFTARPSAYEAITHEWLARQGFTPRAVLMRGKGDRRHSRELKFVQLMWLINMLEVPRERIAAAYDDRPDVVEMFRQQGIAAECCPIHDICAYTPPTERSPKS